jgi:hypothetical protein
MKLSRILGGVALLSLSGSAFADQSIEITGATAFRVGAIKAIVALYGAGLTDIAHTSTSTATNGHELANDCIFRGTIDGCDGITTIRCSWSGSVEGVGALTGISELYLPAAAIGTGTSYSGPASGTNRCAVTTAQVGDTDSEIAFSDVFATSTPFATPALDTVVGILPFFAVINDGAPAEFTNLTAQKWGQLLDAGFLPANYIFPTTSSKLIFATGRNDGSGTRTAYVAIARGGSLAGFGRNQVEKGDIAGVVNQWRPDAAVSDEIPVIRRWPTGDGANASTVWGPDSQGNGGYSSGSTVAARLAAKSTSVQRQTATGTNIGAPVGINFVSVLGLSDAITAQNGGARVLAWDGVPVTVTNPLASTEEDKFRNGSYTLWSYEHMFANELTACEQAVYDALVTGIPANLAGAGIDPTTMAVGRVDDGTDVTPL